MVLNNLVLNSAYCLYNIFHTCPHNDLYSSEMEGITSIQLYGHEHVNGHGWSLNNDDILIF